MRWLRDPLAHFLALGALIFAAHRALAPAGEPGEDDRVVVLDEPFVDALVRERAARVGRPVEAIDRGEVRAAYVREEALVREARSLALDGGDAIIRRRLVQKLELLVRAGVEVAEPTDAELGAYLAAHASEHREPPRVSFEHRYFSAERRGEQAMGDATGALVEILVFTDEDVAARHGDAFPHGARLERRDLASIEELFGVDFATALSAAPDGRWTGPIASRFGAHLVRVTGRTEERALTLEEVRSVIRARVIDEREDAATEAALDAIVASYRIDEGP